MFDMFDVKQNSNPITDLEEKRIQLNALLDQYETEDHTMHDVEYEHLDEDEILQLIKNQNGGSDLGIMFGEDFTIIFGSSQARYAFTETGYHCFYNDLNAILNNEICVVTVKSTRRWMGSGFFDASTISDDDPFAVINRIIDMPMFVEEIRNNGGSLELEFWNPELNRIINC